jgi:methyl-accepting chemotaxis protein
MNTTVNLKKRILLGYLVPVLLLVAVSVAVYVNVRTVEQASSELGRMNNVQRELNKYHTDTERLMRAVRAALLTGDKRAVQMYEGASSARAESSNALDRLVLDRGQRETLREVMDAGDRIRVNSEAYTRQVEAGQLDEAIKAFRATDEVGFAKRHEDLLLRFERREAEFLAEASGLEKDALARLLWVVFSATAAAVLAAIALGNLIAGRISIGIGSAVVGVSTSSTEIAATVTEHERAVSQQAAAVSETTSTVEELGASSRQSASQAEATAEAARHALQVTQEGIAFANRVAESMVGLKQKVGSVAQQILRLSEQAQQIGSIAKVVGELASETNMLALNAAVEAARAGEHGKGFAVVAAEVRKLADQSKKSGERANALVAEIQKATNSAVMVTDEGTRTAEEVASITEKTLEAFAALAGTANGVSESAQQVLLNSRQQAAALAQVTEAMKSLSAGSREMAAGTVQTKAGLLKLNTVALELRAMI